MKNNEGKISESSEDMPIKQWTIDYKKCTVCGECLDACIRGLLVIKNNKVVNTNQFLCGRCKTCSSVCASEAIKVI